MFKSGRIMIVMPNKELDSDKINEPVEDQDIDSIATEVEESFDEKSQTVLSDKANGGTKIEITDDNDVIDTKDEITEAEEESYIDDLVEDESEESEEDSVNNEEENENIEESDDSEDQDTDEEVGAEDDEQDESQDTQEPEDGEPNVEDKTIGDAIDESEQNKYSYKSDPEVDAAVDDIVRTESDESIAEADAKIAALQLKKSKPSFKQRVKNFFAGWWNNKPIRYGTLSAIGILLVAVILLPNTRYAFLNTVGVRVSSSMTVVDSQTKLPLKDINVQIQDKSGKTDDNGNVTLTELKLGDSDLVIAKRGYADINEQIVLGWGSNPIGEQYLVATGVQYTFVLSDWKSDKPINDAEASSGENSAKADENGKIILTVGDDESDGTEVKISAENYREEVFSGNELSDEMKIVKMVPAKKHTYVSTRDGQYDIYTIDVDGKNEKLLLEATKKEREVPVVYSHPTKNLVAFTSSREGEENSEGFILDGLYLIDNVSAEQERIARSEQIQVIGWSGDNLVYLQIVEGTSAGNDERSKIVSYNIVTGERIDLAKANYFNDVELVADKLYYAVSSFSVPESQAKLFSVNIDGKNNKNVVDSQVWNIFRTKYDTLLFSAVDQKWFQQIGDGPVEEIAKQSAPVSLHFIKSPNSKRIVWVEIRDGKGVLLKSETDNFKEEQVISMPGLYDALYWVNDSSVVLRVISNSETADYIYSLDGGEMQKITDVTATRDTYF